MYFSDAVADWMSDFINVNEDYLTIISFIVTFIVFVVLMRLLGRILSGLLEAICLGFVDKIGGFVFGALKGVLLVSIIVMIMNVFNATNLINEDLRDSSRLFTFTESIADMLYENHEEFEDTIEDAFERGMDKMEDKIDAIEDIVEANL